MSIVTPPAVNPGRPRSAPRSRLNAFDRRANRALKWLARIGGALIFVAMFLIGYQVVDGAVLAFNHFGIGFIGHKAWIPAAGQFGAYPFLIGTLVTGFVSIFLATILGVAIGLFLGLMAPRRVAMIVGPMVEMLAAIPSVVLGLIGIYLIAPFISQHVEPGLHSVLGFIPIFGDPQPIGNSLFTASLVLTIMVVPIIAALTRDLFLTVPMELRDGAQALGATRWEMIRGVVLPTTSSGVIAACVLGFGRAIGEAIAVSQVVGDLPLAPLNLFQGGDTLASRVALQYTGAVSPLHTSSLFYLAVLLFVLEVIVNLTARSIARGVRGAQ
jgi:phosphate transport system permease protein